VLSAEPAKALMALIHVLSAETAKALAALIHVLSAETAKALAVLIHVLPAETAKAVTAETAAALLGGLRTALAFAALGAHHAMTLRGRHSIAAFAWASGLLGGLPALLGLGFGLRAIRRLGLGVRPGFGHFVPQGLDLVLEVANLLLERLLLCGRLRVAAGCIRAAAISALAEARLRQQHQSSGTHQGNHQFDSHKLFPFL
jgi:hypothetical protein